MRLGPDYSARALLSAAQQERAPLAWRRTPEGYSSPCGRAVIGDNGAGLGGARGAGRWAAELDGRWLANADYLAEAKALLLERLTWNGASGSLAREGHEIA